MAFFQRTGPNRYARVAGWALRGWLVALLAGGAAVLLVDLGPGGGWLANVVSDALSRRTAATVTCRRVSLLPGYVEGDDVHLSLPGGIQVRAGRVRVVLAPGPLLSGRVAVIRMRLDGFDVVLPSRRLVQDGPGQGGDGRGNAPAGLWQRLDGLARTWGVDGRIQLELSEGTVTIAGGREAMDPIAVRAVALRRDPADDERWRASIVLPAGDAGGEHHVGVVVAGDLDTVRLTCDGVGFDLEPFRSWLSVLWGNAGDGTALVTRLPVAGGQVSAEVHLAERTAHVTGKLLLSGMVVDHPVLARVPVGPIDLVQRVDLSLSWRPLCLHVARWQGWVNGAAYSATGTLCRDGVGWPVTVRIVLDDLPYQDILDAVPASVVPALAGARLGGSLDLQVEIEGDLSQLGELDIDWKGDWSRLWLAEPSDVLKGSAPLEGRAFFPESKTGVVQRIVLGRGSPSWVRLEDLPYYFVDALLVSEDISFYRHQGIDTSGILDALHENLKAGKAVRGGSTITQQLAKNLFLSRERTLARKFQEAVLAWQLEKRLGKDTILEYYVNIIEWGPGVYGVERAARRYFAKTASELTLREAVFLCSIIPSPVHGYGYFARGHVSPAWDRYLDTLLGKMHRFGYIDDDELARGLAESLTFQHGEVGLDGKAPFVSGSPGLRAGVPSSTWEDHPVGATGPQGPSFE